MKKYEVKIVWNGGDTSFYQIIEAENPTQALNQVSDAIFESLEEFVIYVRKYHPIMP
jgi:hypothetical protein